MKREITRRKKKERAMWSNDDSCEYMEDGKMGKIKTIIGIEKAHRKKVDNLGVEEPLLNRERENE